MIDDQALLARYAANRDTAAFEELARRHAGLVTSLCDRVLRNKHDAEEVNQECWLELARNASGIHSSVIGWLNKAATSRSLNFLRSGRRRKKRERCRGQQVAEIEPTELARDELQCVVERAISELSEELRQPVMLQFFGGRSQREVASELGINQSTVSRRIQDALNLLREKLTRAGYASAAPAIIVVTAQPAAMASEMSSTDLISPDSAGQSAVAAGTALAGAWKWVTMTALPFLACLLLDGWISLLVAFGLVLLTALIRPAWIVDLYDRLGLQDIYRQPTFFLSRWRWNQPPVGWGTEVVVSLLWSAFVFSLAAAFATRSGRIPWGTVVLGFVVATGLFTHAIRLLIHVSRVSQRSLNVTESIDEQGRKFESRTGKSLPAIEVTAWRWFDAFQLVGIGSASLIWVLSRVLNASATIELPSAMLVTAIGAGLFVNGCRLVSLLARNRSRCLSDVANANELSVCSRPDGHAAGYQAVVAICGAIVASLSCWVVWNPLESRYVSLAALQTLILGWMVYRLAMPRSRTGVGRVCTVALFLMIACFVLNSGVCLANWTR